MENTINILKLKKPKEIVKSNLDSIVVASEHDSNMQSAIDNWGIGKNWKNINLESAKFFFSQAEIMLQGLLTDYYLVTKRAYWFLTIVTSIFSFGLKLIYDYYTKDSSNDWCLYIGLIILVFTSIIFGILFYLIFPKSIRAIGSPPSKLVNEVFYKEKDYQYQTLAIYISEITSYEQRIQTYISINKERGEKIKKVLILLVVLAISSLLTFWVGQV